MGNKLNILGSLSAESFSLFRVDKELVTYKDIGTNTTTSDTSVEEFVSSLQELQRLHNVPTNLPLAEWNDIDHLQQLNVWLDKFLQTKKSNKKVAPSRVPAAQLSPAALERRRKANALAQKKSRAKKKPIKVSKQKLVE